jgi:aminoglycoside N3'-acetyltransferase
MWKNIDEMKINYVSTASSSTGKLNECQYNNLMYRRWNHSGSSVSFSGTDGSEETASTTLKWHGEEISVTYYGTNAEFGKCLGFLSTEPGLRK